MKQHMLTFLLLMIAFVFYFVGFALPAGVFLLMGFLAELFFWFRLLRIGRDRKPGR